MPVIGLPLFHVPPEARRRPGPPAGAGRSWSSRPAGTPRRRRCDRWCSAGWRSAGRRATSTKLSVPGDLTARPDHGNRLARVVEVVGVQDRCPSCSGVAPVASVSSTVRAPSTGSGVLYSALLVFASVVTVTTEYGLTVDGVRARAVRRRVAQVLQVVAVERLRPRRRRGSPRPPGTACPSRPCWSAGACTCARSRCRS